MKNITKKITLFTLIIAALGSFSVGFAHEELSQKDKEALAEGYQMLEVIEVQIKEQLGDLDNAEFAKDIIEVFGLPIAKSLCNMMNNLFNVVDFYVLEELSRKSNHPDIITFFNTYDKTIKPAKTKIKELEKNLNKMEL